MSFDPRDQIWNATFETYYSTFFEEMVCDALIDRWQWLDETSKILVALTATGSAVAGWALWQEQGWKAAWTVLAGASALIAIFHSALDVSGRLKGHGDNRRLYAGIRIDLETFRYRMQADREFPVDKFTEELVELRKRFGQAFDRGRSDFMLSEKMRNKVQDELNERIGDKVVS